MSCILPAKKNKIRREHRVQKNTGNYVVKIGFRVRRVFCVGGGWANTPPALVATLSPEMYKEMTS
jgi:hypothetical protein